jgi:hypothetical protein
MLSAAKIKQRNPSSSPKDRLDAAVRIDKTLLVGDQKF